jgi:sugar/nucleoside kinase (ribokinase family)
MSKKYDVTAVCNALMDILVQATDADVAALKLKKGVMTLVTADQQRKILKHFTDHDKTVELGGSAMNAIRALALLGKKTAFAGMVSDDEFGLQIRDRMSALGIHSQLGESGEPTGTCLILVTPDGERTMATCLGASRLYDDSHIPVKELKESRIFHFCGYQWDTEEQKSAISTAIEVAKSNGCLISFDVADPFVVRNHRADFLDMIKKCADIVFANEEEAKLLFNNTAEEAGHRIAQAGAIAVIKLGSRGAMICQESKVIPVAPVKTTVVDTTAAGDMFAGGFLFGLSSDCTLEESGKMAAALASDVISRYGAVLSEGAITAVRGRLG